jgi:hypothetical protein
VAIKLFELGFVCKTVDYLSGTLKKIEGLSGFLNLTQAMAVAVEAAKLARGTTGDLTGTTSAPTTVMLNFGDTARRPIRNATMHSDKMAALQPLFKFTSLSGLAEAMKKAGPAARGRGMSLDQTLSALAALSSSTSGAMRDERTGGAKRSEQANLRAAFGVASLRAAFGITSLRALSGEAAGKGFLEIMTQMSRASRRLGFEVFAVPNREGIDLLKTLQGIQRQFSDISNKDIAAAFEKAFGARAVFIGAVSVIGAIGLGSAALGALAAAPAIIKSWEPVKSFFTRMIPQAFKWGVNLLETFAKGIASGVMWPVHAMENVVTRMRSYLPWSPGRVAPLQDFDRVRIVETIAQAIQPAPMLAAIRRVVAVAAVAMPMMIGGAAMPAAGAISSPAGAVVLNYAPHVEVYAPGADAATIERAVMEALEKNRREVYRMLEQMAGRRERTRFGG